MHRWAYALARRRSARALAGDGIEIGALHRPFPVPAAARVTYLDHLDTATLRAHLRVLRPGGTLLLTLPDRRHGVDIRRDPTTVEHLVRDQEEGQAVSRSAHCREWVERVDVRAAPRQVPGTGRARCLAPAVQVPGTGGTGAWHLGGSRGRCFGCGAGRARSLGSSSRAWVARSAVVCGGRFVPPGAGRLRRGGAG